MARRRIFRRTMRRRPRNLRWTAQLASFSIVQQVQQEHQMDLVVPSDYQGGSTAFEPEDVTLLRIRGTTSFDLNIALTGSSVQLYLCWVVVDDNLSQNTVSPNIAQEMVDFDILAWRCYSIGGTFTGPVVHDWDVKVKRRLRDQRVSLITSSAGGTQDDQVDIVHVARALFAGAR